MLKGSTVAKKTRIPKFEEFDPRISMNQDIYGDIMFINDSPYLICVARPLDLTICRAIKTVKQADLKKGFKVIVDLLNNLLVC
jgi:hypothetical protein